MLAAPFAVPILEALAEGSKQQGDLRRAAGFPPQTTLRTQLKKLAEVGALEKHRRNRFPGGIEYELTAAGHGLLLVTEVLERWLERGSDGPTSLSDSPGRAVVKALAEGWSTTMLRALSARPFTLTELDRVIGSLSYPSLERRLAGMRLAQLLEAVPGTDRGTPYTVTKWLRQGVAPLAAAARWELAHLAESATPIGRVDVEAAFLLAMPLSEFPDGASGSCRMVVEIPNRGKRRLAGVIAEVESGVVSCTTELQGTPDAWVLGSRGGWLDAIVARDLDRLELGGDCSLARQLLEGLHVSLFGARSAIRT